jgi:hypothetical protein
VLDDESCKSKHVAQRYVTLSCCVGKLISVVFDKEKQSGLNQNCVFIETLVVLSSRREIPRVVGSTLLEYSRSVRNVVFPTSPKRVSLTKFFATKIGSNRNEGSVRK